MRHFFRRFLPVFLAAGLLTSCATLPTPAQRFAEANGEFLRLLRWQDFEGASHFLEEPYRKEFLDRFRALEDLRIVDVQLESVAPGKKENRRITWTVVEYYLLPSITVKKFRFRLEWRTLGGDPRHPGPWRIVTPFPPFP